jgi:hypothetical protein
MGKKICKIIDGEAVWFSEEDIQKANKSKHNIRIKDNTALKWHWQNGKAVSRDAGKHKFKSPLTK